MKLKKYKSIGNKEEKYNTWYTRRAMEMNTINRSQKQSCLMQKR